MTEPLQPITEPASKPPESWWATTRRVFNQRAALLLPWLLSFGKAAPADASSAVAATSAIPSPEVIAAVKAALGGKTVARFSLLLSDRTRGNRASIFSVFVPPPPEAEGRYLDGPKFHCGVETAADMWIHHIAPRFDELKILMIEMMANKPLWDFLCAEDKLKKEFGTWVTDAQRKEWVHRYFTIHRQGFNIEDESAEGIAASYFPGSTSLGRSLADITTDNLNDVISALRQSVLDSFLQRVGGHFALTPLDKKIIQSFEERRRVSDELTPEHSTADRRRMELLWQLDTTLETLRAQASQRQRD